MTTNDTAPPQRKRVAGWVTTVYARGRTPKSAVRSNIDVVEGRRIAGWAYDSSRAHAALTVEATSSAGQRARATADIFRQDLREAGIGNGAHCFEIDLSGWTQEAGEVTVRVVETQDVLGVFPFDTGPLPASPARREESAPASRWRWNIDRVDSRSVLGWIQDTRSPSGAVLLQALGETGRSVLITADLYRADLEEAGIGDGRHGFEVNLAEVGARNAVTLLIAETGEPLTPAPIPTSAVAVVKSGGISDQMKVQLRMALVEIAALARDHGIETAASRD
ncbi:hypothetical protein [Methylobacterium sp. WSM2598]|uniref:hypothetical protein n=1 Tax=Methylobacterium sp. WSM2598 TaxID=398261 RepID=UPI00037F90F2|nr:hypothetical protein [Methylobacterium sp. WSM2598]